MFCVNFRISNDLALILLGEDEVEWFTMEFIQLKIYVFGFGVSEGGCFEDIVGVIVSLADGDLTKDHQELLKVHVENSVPLFPHHIPAQIQFLLLSNLIPNVVLRTVEHPWTLYPYFLYKNTAVTTKWVPDLDKF
jgi:hypothetical protein